MPHALYPLLTLLVGAVLAVAIVQGAWNRVAPSFDGMRRISYFQAFCLSAGVGCLLLFPIFAFFLVGHAFG